MINKGASMKNIAKIKDAYNKICFILTKQQKQFAILVFIMSLVAAIFEMIGVSVIVPLMTALLSADELIDKWYIKPFIDMFHITDTDSLVFFVCSGVIMVYIIKNIYSALYTWVSSKYTCKIQRELSVRILDAYLKQGYIFFVNNNSGALLRGIGADVTGTFTIISQSFNLISKLLMIVCIGVFILFKTPQIALILIAMIMFCLIIVQLLFRRQMQESGKKQRHYEVECNMASIEAIQGSKEVLILNRQEQFVNRYKHNMSKLNKVTIKLNLGASLPSYIIEAICVTGLLIAVAIEIRTTANPYDLIAQLSAVAIAAFRILPCLGGITSAINAITFHAPSLVAAYETLHTVKMIEADNKIILSKKKKKSGLEKKDFSHVEFQNELSVEGLTFRYPNTEKNILENLDLTIKKGSSVAFIGSSGSGKTTLADVLLGLLEPQGGYVKMDGIEIDILGIRWNGIIGYVPQSVYMTDSTIRRNIAFGIEEDLIDDEKVWKALDMAQLKDFVEKLPEKLDTYVGEWGVKFSGGQRQRVAIARALYNDPSILVLDEATAALDTETESAVMEAIDVLQGYKTLIIVAHRLSTVRNCDEIYEIREGKAIKKSKEEIFS